MKIIRKLIGINLFLICFTLFLISCNKNKVEKKEFIGRRGPIKKDRLKIIKSHKWKLERIYLYNNTDFIVSAKDRIRFENIQNKILEFRENGVYINNELVGDATYEGEMYTINNIDTLTNKFYLYRLKNNSLTLKNDVGYYKDKKLLKSYSLELSLTSLK